MLRTFPTSSRSFKSARLALNKDPAHWSPVARVVASQIPRCISSSEKNHGLRFEGILEINLQGNRPPMAKNRQIRLLERAQSSGPFNSFRILHGRLTRSESAPCRHGEAPAAEHSIWAMPLQIPRVRPQASYLKESATRVRNAATFPFSTFMSILVTSATRRSRNEPAAVSTALRPASSHDVSLTPTTSTIL